MNLKERILKMRQNLKTIIYIDLAVGISLFLTIVSSVNWGLYLTIGLTFVTIYLVLLKSAIIKKTLQNEKEK